MFGNIVIGKTVIGKKSRLFSGDNNFDGKIYDGRFSDKSTGRQNSRLTFFPTGHISERLLHPDPPAVYLRPQRLVRGLPPPAPPLSGCMGVVWYMLLKCLQYLMLY